MNYYRLLNEGFDKLLTEAKQDEINFANVFGQDMLDRFKAQKQRLHSPENDFYHWIRAAKSDLNGTIEKLDGVLAGLEKKMSRSQKSKLAAEGADIIYEDDEWIVLKINTYEAAVKYGAGSRWCITGRYPGYEDEGEDYFNQYRDDCGCDYYFFIKKDGRDLEGRQEKWCLLWGEDMHGYYAPFSVFDAEDRQTDFIPDAPEIDGFPDVSVPPDHHEDTDDDLEYVGDEDGNAGGHAAHHMAPPPFEMRPVDNPNEYEFPANTMADAVKAFKADAEIAEQINDTLCIVKWHEEPTQPAEPAEAPAEGEGQPAEEQPQDTGDRYTAFVFFPGEGGGPLLAQTGGDGFALQVFFNIDAARDFARRMTGGQINDNGIRNSAHDMDADGLPECLKENFWYYDDGAWRDVDEY